MISIRRFLALSIAVGVAASSSLVFAQTSAIQEKLESQYALTKATADHSDIVTAGAVLVLKKDSLLMDTTTSTVPMANTYKDGKIVHGAGDVLSKGGWLKKIPGVSSIPGASNVNVDTRTFVAGEKFWVTKIDVAADGVVLQFFSDPIKDVRYYSTLKFPFPKGSTPDPDKVLSTVGEVIQVQPSDDTADNKDAPAAPGKAAPGGKAAPAAAAAPATAMAPIPPPPPPADTPPPQPKTIALHQTKDEVVAIMGPPTKVVKLAGTKEIDFYADMKVTFIGGKVSDVQ